MRSIAEYNIMVDISKYYKEEEIGAEVMALYAVIAPILKGITYSLKQEVLNDFNLTYDTITLSQLARVYREGSETMEYVLNMLYMMQLYIITPPYWNELILLS